MDDSRQIICTLIEEGIAARVHFQVWWALRNKALPNYYDTMNNLNYVDFFHASNAGHYKLFLLALSKIFDQNRKVAGLKKLCNALTNEGRENCSSYIEKNLFFPFHDQIETVKRIRDKSLVHNSRFLSRNEVYEINGITPNQIRQLIDSTCEVINYVAAKLEITNLIFDSDRSERATMKMLEVLKKWKYIIISLNGILRCELVDRNS